MFVGERGGQGRGSQQCAYPSNIQSSVFGGLWGVGPLQSNQNSCMRDNSSFALRISWGGGGERVSAIQPPLIPHCPFRVSSAYKSS